MPRSVLCLLLLFTVEPLLAAKQLELIPGRAYLRLQGLALDSPSNPKRLELEAGIRDRLAPGGSAVGIFATVICAGCLVVAGQAGYDRGECVAKGDVWVHRPAPRTSATPAARVRQADARPMAGSGDRDSRVSPVPSVVQIVSD